MPGDELDLEQLDSDIEKESKAEKRIKDLSEKVRLTADERDERDKLLAKEREEKEQVIKERDFFSSFGDQVARYPDASGFKDKIKELVLKGYTVEHATTAVLVAEGKYTPPAQPRPIVDNPAGGSAPTLHQPTGDRTISQLTREEKRAKLIEAEQRGDLSVS